MKTIALFFSIFVNLSFFSQTDSVRSYYKKIAFGDEFTLDTVGERKWQNDVKVFVLGEQEPELISELKRIINELNNLIVTINIELVYEKNQANVLVFLGSKQEFINIDRGVEQYVRNNEGLFKIDYYGRKIVYAKMYVNTKGNNSSNEKKHLLREEFTQLLGLCNDSYRYRNSIFFQGWTDTTEYAEIDKELIKMLYNK